MSRGFGGWGKWEFEAAVRASSHVPASILGFTDRGLIAPGYAGDVVIFDPDTIGPGDKEFRNVPRGGARWISGATGVHATIANGTPIVIDGEIQEDAGRPGRVLRPGIPAPMMG